MKKILRHVKQVREVNRYVKNPSRYYFLEQNSEFRVNEARRLHAETYHRIGFIDSTEITSDGLISLKSDPYQEHSEYFIVIDELTGRVAATARHILFNPKKGPSSFPLLRNAKISKSFKDHIKHADLSRYVEVSGLVKRRGSSSLTPLILYKEMLKRSLKEDHDRWLMALDVHIYQKLSYVFGQNLQIIGEITQYKGGEIIPLMLTPKTALEVMESEIKLSDNVFQRRIRREFLEFFKADKAFIYEHERNNQNEKRRLIKK